MKKRERYITFIFFLLFPVWAQSQYAYRTFFKTLDTLQPRQRFLYVMKNGYEFHFDNAEKLIDFGDTLLKRNIRKEDLYTSLSAHLLKGLGFSGTASYAKAVNNYLSGLKLIEDTTFNNGLNDKQSRQKELFKADFILGLGRVYFEIKSYKTADSLFKQSLRIYKQNNDSLGMALSYNELGRSALKQKEPEKSATLYKKTLQIYRGLCDSTGMAKAYNNLAIALIRQEKFIESNRLLNRALEFHRQKKNKIQEARILYNLGLLQSYLNDYDKKLYYFQKSYDILDSLNDTKGKIRVLENIAQYYYTKHQYELCKKSLDKAFAFANQMNSISQILSIYREFSILFSQKGNYQKAFEYQQKYEKLQDSIIRNSKESINELTVRYETERVERMKDLLIKEKQISELLANRQKNFRIFVIVLSLLVTVIMLILFSRYRLKVKTAKILAQQSRALQRVNNVQKKFLSIIGHDLKNPLGTSKALSEFLAENFSELSDKQKQQTLQNLYKSTGAAYALVENLMHWAALQTDTIQLRPEKINLKKHLSDVFSLLATQAQGKSIVLRAEIPGYLEVCTDKNMLSLVLRNLLSNAIKFSPEKGTVTVKAEETENDVKISVTDNGIGIGKEQIQKLFEPVVNLHLIQSNNNKGTGLGLLICKEFVEKGGGKIFVESIPGKKTVFTFTIPKNNNICEEKN